MCEKFKNLIKDKIRFWGSIFSLLFGLFFLFILPNYLKIDLFYAEPLKDFNNYPRLFWCLAFTFIGFSFPACRASLKSHNDNAWITYLFVYPPILIVISFLVFAVLHLFEITSGYLFYFLSLPLCL